MEADPSDRPPAEDTTDDVGSPTSSPPDRPRDEERLLSLLVRAASTLAAFSGLLCSSTARFAEWSTPEKNFCVWRLRGGVVIDAEAGDDGVEDRPLGDERIGTGDTGDPIPPPLRRRR